MIDPLDLLRAYAGLAEQHPLFTVTPGGLALQQAFIAFLRTSADADAPKAEVLADFHAIVARNLVAISMAFHETRLCSKCTLQIYEDLGDQVADEFNALADTQDEPLSPKGLH